MQCEHKRKLCNHKIGFTIHANLAILHLHNKGYHINNFPTTHELVGNLTKTTNQCKLKSQQIHVWIKSFRIYSLQLFWFSSWHFNPTFYNLWSHFPPLAPCKYHTSHNTRILCDSHILQVLISKKTILLINSR
jgi:hypothetical protein